MDISNEIINPDRNVSPSFFKEKGDQLLVRNIFKTIQGEMPFAGYPAVFLRTGGCNRGAKLDIGCAGCDTEFQIDKSDWWNAQDLAAGILSSMLMDSETNGGPPRILVVTGGEPMLQKEGLVKLFREMGYLVANKLNVHRQYVIQFETNGDYNAAPYFFENVFEAYEDWLSPNYVISPKSPYGKKMWWSDARLFDADNYPSKLYIRRVISGEPGSHYYDIPDEILAIIKRNPRKVYVSPQTFYKSMASGRQPTEADGRDFIDWEKTDRSVKRAIELASNYGCLVSFQSHAYINLR